LGSYFDGGQAGPSAGDGVPGPLSGPAGLQGSFSATGSGWRALGGFMGPQSASFADFLASYAPGLLPGRAPGPAAATEGGQAIRDLPHATTIVAAACDHGVVLAGDRRATAGSMIVKRDFEKVFRSDEYSAVGYAGTGSVGIEFVRLFQVELEHYEKMEGRSLSLEGKANRLAWMIRGNLAAAMQGLIVVPLFVGYDEEAGQGRIFSYDVAGGPYEEHRFHSIGSGSVFARGSLKKLYVDDMPVRDAVLVCVQALYDAADDDSATGGPDLTRRIFPVIATVMADGFRKLSEAESEEYAQQVVQERMATPDGPSAPLRPAS
jgi:proteasome beta subunit